MKAQADVEYRNDGGRDLASGQHPRTRDQRGFDAAHTLLTGHASESATANDTKPGSSPTAQNRRAIIFVKTTVDQLTGIDPSLVTTADGKPLPHSIVEQLAKDAEYIGQIFSARGELLWQGRRTRLATPAQIFGLIARDGGCVRCGNHHDNCVAHHLLPYEAPGRGETNIDQLAFVCDDCHNRLHTNKQTLYRDPITQTWKIRPATWDEIPPDKPPQTGGPQAKGPPGAYTNSAKRRPRHTTPEPGNPNPKPRLDEQCANTRRHDRLF